MPRKKRKYVRRKPYPEIPLHMQAKPEVVLDIEAIRTANLKTMNEKPFINLLGTLMDVDDIMTRTLMPYIVVGDLAKQIIEEVDQPMGDKVELVVKRREYSQHAYDTLSLFVPDLKKEDAIITFTVNSIPVKVTVVEHKYRFFENPDTRFYYTGNFFVPNPFKMYWEVREIF